jgi:anthranilate/para-aminobenzoate synthase component II
MAVTHKDFKNLFGVQYHPESILSEYGHQLLKNFLKVKV